MSSPNSSQTPMLYSSKSTFLTFSSQIPTNSVNLTKFLPFPYMRNIKFLRGILRTTIFLLWRMTKLLRFSVVYYEILTKSCEEFSYRRLTKWPSTIGIRFVTTSHSLPVRWFQEQGTHITTVSWFRGITTHFYHEITILTRFSYNTIAFSWTPPIVL